MAGLCRLSSGLASVSPVPERWSRREPRPFLMLVATGSVCTRSATPSRRGRAAPWPTGAVSLLGAAAAHGSCPPPCGGVRSPSRLSPGRQGATARSRDARHPRAVRAGSGPRRGRRRLSTTTARTSPRGNVRRLAGSGQRGFTTVSVPAAPSTSMRTAPRCRKKTGNATDRRRPATAAASFTPIPSGPTRTAHAAPNGGRRPA